LALQARQRIAALTTQKNNLNAEKEALIKKLEDTGTALASSDSEKVSSLKSNQELTKTLEDVEAKNALLDAKNKSLSSEKDNVEKTCQELRAKVVLLEQNIEEKSLRLKILQSQFDMKLSRMQKDLEQVQEKYTKQGQDLEKLKSQINKPQLKTTSLHMSPVSSVSMSSVIVGAPTPSHVSASTTQPPRHSVLPQQQQSFSKSTPTASIKPLSVDHNIPRITATRSSPSNQMRPSNVVTVQPTTEELVTQLPQATVAPTHAVVVVAPTSSSTAEPALSSLTSSTNALSSFDMPEREAEPRENRVEKFLDYNMNTLV